jgi:hypothetical protein
MLIWVTLIISFHGIRGKAVTSLNVELGVEKSQTRKSKRKILKHFTRIVCFARISANLEE